MNRTTHLGKARNLTMIGMTQNSSQHPHHNRFFPRTMVLCVTLALISVVVPLPAVMAEPKTIEVGLEAPPDLSTPDYIKPIPAVGDDPLTNVAKGNTGTNYQYTALENVAVGNPILINVVEPPKEACYFLDGAGQGAPYDALFTEQQKVSWKYGLEAFRLTDRLSTYLLDHELSLDLDQGKPAGTQINTMVAELMDRDDILGTDFRFQSKDAMFEALQAVASTAPAQTALSDILKYRSCPGSTDGSCADPTPKPGDNKPPKPTFAELYPWSATAPWNVTLGGLNKTFIEEDIKNDVKVCMHEKYDTPNFMNVDEYSSMVHAFKTYKKQKKKNPNNGTGGGTAAGEKTPKELAQEKADTIMGPVSEVTSFQWAYGYEYGTVDDKMQSVLDVLGSVYALSEGDAILDKTARKIDWKPDNLVELTIGVTKIKNGPSESGVNVLRMNAVAEFPEPLNDVSNDSSLADQIAAIFADYGFKDPSLIFDRDVNNDRAGKLLLINLELRATEPASASPKSMKSSKKTSRKLVTRA